MSPSNNPHFGVIVILFFISVVLVIFALEQQRNAFEAQNTANRLSTQIADTSIAASTEAALRQTAEQDAISAQATIVAFSTQLADISSDLEAKSSRNTELERSNAEIQSRLLADAASEVFQSGDSALALSLAVEAVKILPDSVTARRVLTDIASAPGARHMEAVSDQIHSAAYHGSILLTGHSNGQLTQWDVENEWQQTKLEGHDTLVKGLDFNADGTIAASSDFNGNIILWDMTTRTQLRRLRGHTNSTYSVDFSPDGTQLISGGGDLNRSEIILWDVETGKIIHRFRRDESDLVFDVAFSPDGQLIVSGSSWIQGVDLWDVASGKHVRHLDSPRGMNAFEVTFSPDGSKVAAALSDKVALIWDAETGDLLHRLHRTDAYGLSSVAFSADGQQLASGDYSGSLHLWDVQTGGLIRQLHGHSTEIVDLVFSGGRLLSAGGSWEKSEVFLWHMENSFTVQQSPAKNYTFNQAAFDGSIAVLGEYEGAARVVDLTTGETIHELNGHTDFVSAIALSPNGAFIVTGSWDGRIIVWDRETGKEVKQFTGNGGKVYDLDFSDDGQMLLSVSDNSAMVRDFESGDFLYEFPGAARIGDFRVDGRVIALGLSNGVVRVIELGNGENSVGLYAHDKAVIGIEFSADGQRLVTAGEYDGFAVWDTTIWETIYRQETGNYATIALHPDGSAVLTGGTSEDYSTGETILWNATTGEILQKMESDSLPVNTVAFDGTTAYSAASNTTYYPNNRIVHNSQIVQWSVVTDLLAWVQENRYVRELTCDERRTYGVMPFCESE